MRRSTRLEAANGKKGARISEMIARHADHVRKDDAEEDWKPAEDEEADVEEDEEDNHSSDSDFAEEKEPRTRAASKRRIQTSSSESSAEEEAAHGQLKRERPPSGILKAREVMGRIRERGEHTQSRVKRAKLQQIDIKNVEPGVHAAKGKKASISDKAKGVQLQITAVKPPAAADGADAHRRPSKQQQRGPKPAESAPTATQHVSLASTTTSNTVTHFFNEILEWNLFDALRREALKEYDFSEANDGSEEGEVEIAKVPSQFDSYDHYFSVWKPLALEEVQAQTVNSVTTDRPPPATITANVLGSASFATKTSKVRVDFKKRQGSTSKRDPSKSILDGLYANDLVVVTSDLRFFDKALATSGRGSHSHSTIGQEKNAADTSEPPRGVLGIVSSQRSSREGLIMSVLSTAWSMLDQETDLYLFKLNNLVTSVREFRALCDCRDYQLMPLILSGHHESGSMRLDSLGLEYVRWLTRSFNESQLEAITAAATSHGFTLIKGPPGTGKTTTLKGLLNSLHLREYSRYYNAVLEVARRPDRETNKAWAAIGNEKPHILVTAPSNAAVDNIVAKVIEEGFCDGEGRRYFPKIVRVGRGMSASVRSVGLEDMVDQICSRPVDELEHHILRLRHDLAMVERDAVNLREHLRQIVGWIDRDPDAALAAQLQPQPPPPDQTQHMPPLELPSDPTVPASPPPPPPLSPHLAPSDSSSSVQAYPPPPPTWSPDAPPPPSPPGPASPLGETISSTDAPSFYPTGQLDDEEDEEEEDEEFPVSYGENSAVFAEGAGAFNAQESGKAFSAFLDDESSADEDEPLPTAYIASEEVISKGGAVEPAAEHPEIAGLPADSVNNSAAEVKKDADEATSPISSANETTEESTVSVPSDETLDQPDVEMKSDAEELVRSTTPPGVCTDIKTESAALPDASVEASCSEDISQPDANTTIAMEIAQAEKKAAEQNAPTTSEEAVDTSDVVMKSDGEDESDEDEPLPQLPPVDPEQTIPTDPADGEDGASSCEDVSMAAAGVTAMAVDFSDDIVPSSPPPPPPLSPPPPPPLSPPPPISDSRPSSPTVMPLSPAPEPPTASTAAAARANGEPIDYAKYQEYRAVAQQINFCLEKLSEVKLELQRYEFARKTVAERGKLNPATRQSLEVSFLDTAHIVFTTLSSAGVAALDASSRYDVLVVDEAAQAVELSTIIPMKFGSRQCVLVGDPQQLSATVFSRTSGQSLYERSLFERLESCGHPVHMLRTQYRSHPMISEFPRHYFYDGKLQDGENVQSEGYAKPYHHLGPAFTPLVFWNLLSSRESSTKSVSRMNIGEAELAVNLYLTLKKSCPPDSVAGKVGMITPYSQQMEELRSRFRHALGKHYDSEVEINTVDGFQGREKDIIILSTVRADPRAGVGFLNDIRRMNVALTRAKFACYVIGSEATLRSSKPWTALLDHADSRRCVVHVENPKCNLLTLQPMTRPHDGGQRGGGQPPAQAPFPPPQMMGAPFAPPHQQQQVQATRGGWHHDPARAPSFQSQGRRGRGRGDGSTRGRGERRSGGQRGGRSQAPGRGYGRPGSFQAPQPFHATAPPPVGGGWHPVADMAAPPPQPVGAARGGRGGRALVRGRGPAQAPQPGPPPYSGAFVGGQAPAGPPPHQPQPQGFYQQPPPGYNGAPPVNAQPVAGRTGGRNPRDPRFRARGFNGNPGAGRGGAVG